MNTPIAFRCLVIVSMLFSSGLWAQQSKAFNDYVVHYNALRTDMIPAAVAQGYGIRRSSSRALLNITVMETGEEGDETPVQAVLKVDATNLTGQRREVVMREINDTEGAIYYIGELPVHNLETYQFKIEITPQGAAEPLFVDFRQQFYTE